MRMSRSEFLAWEHKAITLVGMSGIGKTTVANKLPKGNWFHYSGDYRIGTKYLQEPIMDEIKKEAMKVPYLRDLLCNDSIYIASNITIHNLEPISAFMGKIGDPAKGGLSRREFTRRQRLHRQAEIDAMHDVEAFIRKSQEIYGYDHFINDASGSLCELDDPACLEVLAKNTVIVYLRAAEHMEELVIDRQKLSPKPLYYNEEFLEQQLAVFLRENNLVRDEDISPDKFVRWVFPRLVEHRRPRYEALAKTYGYVVDAQATELVFDEAGFVDLIAETLDRTDAAA